MPTNDELLALLNQRAAGEFEPMAEPPAAPAVEIREAPLDDRPSLIPYAKQDRVPVIMRGVDIILAMTLNCQPDQLVLLGAQVSPWRRAGLFEVRTGPGEEGVAGYAIILVSPLAKDRLILTRDAINAAERWNGVQVAMMMADREDREGQRVEID